MIVKAIFNVGDGYRKDFLRVWSLHEKGLLHNRSTLSNFFYNLIFPSCFPFHYSRSIYFPAPAAVPLQVWSVKYNKEGNQVSSVSDDKTINIYSIPV